MDKFDKGLIGMFGALILVLLLLVSGFRCSFSLTINPDAETDSALQTEADGEDG